MYTSLKIIAFFALLWGIVHLVAKAVKWDIKPQFKVRVEDQINTQVEKRVYDPIISIEKIFKLLVDIVILIVILALLVGFLALLVAFPFNTIVIVLLVLIAIKLWER